MVLYVCSLWGSTKNICSPSDPLLWGSSKLYYRFALLSEYCSKQWRRKWDIDMVKQSSYIPHGLVCYSSAGTGLGKVGTWDKKKWVCECEEWFFPWKPNPILFPSNNTQNSSEKICVWCSSRGWNPAFCLLTSHHTAQDRGVITHETLILFPSWLRLANDSNVTGIKRTEA